MKQQSWLTGVVVLGSILLAGCQSNGVVQKLHTERFPAIGLEIHAEIGETVLERTLGNGTPGFRLADLEFEQSGYLFFLPGEHYQISYESPEGESQAYGYGNVRSQSEGYSVANSSYQVISNSAIEGCFLRVSSLDLVDESGTFISNWLQLSKGADENNNSGLSIGGRTILSGSILNSSILNSSSSLFSIEVPADACSKRYIFSNYGQTFKQELIYLGRSGDELSFKYREYSGNLARPAFSADLTYDLSKSQTIGYRGARIEVIDAGNQQIRYRVKSHMNGM